MTLFLLSFNAYSYPNFIGKGYHACLTCHYNPYGNGPLNDYGRAVSANVIADRLFVSEATTDEQLGERSGFLFSKPSQTWFRPSLDYRGMQFDYQIDQEKPTRRWINMQMDATVTLKFGEADKYIATFTHGIVPDNSARPDSNGDRKELNYTREAYLGIRIIPELGLYLGKMDKVFGIRVPDHNAYSKRYGNLHQYTSSTGALIHWGKEKFDLGLQYFNGKGDIEKTESEQTKGFTSKFEYSVTDNMRLGASYLSEKDINENSKDMQAILLKAGVGKGSSIMLEVGEIKNTPQTGNEKTSRYIFMQNHINLRRGLYFLTTIENYQSDITKNSEVYGIAPGIQYFPWQRCEIRAELYNIRNFVEDESSPVTNDSWSFIGQVHLWF